MFVLSKELWLLLTTIDLEFEAACIYRESIDGTDLLPYGEHIQQCLSWMLTYTVTSIDHRTTAVLGYLLKHNQ